MRLPHAIYLQAGLAGAGATRPLQAALDASH